MAIALWPEEREMLARISAMRFSVVFGALVAASGVVYYDVLVYDLLPMVSFSQVDPLRSAAGLLSLAVVGIGALVAYGALQTRDAMRYRYDDMHRRLDAITIAMGAWF